MHKQADVGRAFKRSRRQDRRYHLPHLIAHDLAAKDEIPQFARHAKARIGLAVMMYQVARPQMPLEDRAWLAEVDPVMDRFVGDEARNRTGKENHPWNSAEEYEPADPNDRYGDPRADREDPVRVSMMNVMERGGERLKRMAQPRVDNVLNEGPCEHSRDETGNAGNHTQQFYPARNRLKRRQGAIKRGELVPPFRRAPTERNLGTLSGERSEPSTAAERSETSERVLGLREASEKSR